MVEILLGVIAVLIFTSFFKEGVTRLLPLKIRRNSHYNAKREVMYKKEWDLRFLIEQYKLVREGVRKEFDRLHEQMDAFKKRVEAEKAKEDPDKTIVEQMEKKIEATQSDVNQLSQQLEGLDNQIEGPDGFEDKIDGLRTTYKLLGTLKKK